MEILAIIPARGGSKGIRNKNTKLLASKPLIAYAIESACKARLDRIIVSTDNEKIAAISTKMGAEIIWRPEDISGDSASSETALLHAVNYLEKSEGYQADILVMLQCTSPLTLPEDIDGTIQTLLDTNADSALAVTPFHYFIWQTDKNGCAVGINHKKEVRLLRQQNNQQYLETGAVYVMRLPEFKEAKHRFFGKTSIYIMPPERCLEIDEPSDLSIAEFLIENRKKENLILQN
jgi:N-acylneuraminate cytidylyltransferase